MATSWPSKKLGTNGFSTMWAVASAAERVMVTSQPVATNPRRHRTNSLPLQNESRLSSIAIDPCPCGLSSATRWYIGSAPKRVKSTMSRVAMGESAPAARAAIPGI
jgi:hypothetical protein